MNFEKKEKNLFHENKILNLEFKFSVLSKEQSLLFWFYRYAKKKRSHWQVSGKSGPENFHSKTVF